MLGCARYGDRGAGRARDRRLLPQKRMPDAPAAERVDRTARGALPGADGAVNEERPFLQYSLAYEDRRHRAKEVARNSRADGVARRQSLDQLGVLHDRDAALAGLREHTDAGGAVRLGDDHGKRGLALLVAQADDAIAIRD